MPSLSVSVQLQCPPIQFSEHKRSGEVTAKVRFARGHLKLDKSDVRRVFTYRLDVNRDHIETVLLDPIALDTAMTHDWFDWRSYFRTPHQYVVVIIETLPPDGDQLLTIMSRPPNGWRGPNLSRQLVSMIHDHVLDLYKHDDSIHLEEDHLTTDAD